MSLPRITLNYDPEFAELTVEAIDGAFRGVARAIVTKADVEEIARFIVNVRTYPLKRCCFTLAHADLVRLTALQRDAAGHVLLVAEIGEGAEFECKAVRIGIRLDLAVLHRFSQDLSRMMLLQELHHIEVCGDAG